MLSGISRSVDLVVPIQHTRFPCDEPLEEKAVHSLFYIHDKYWRSPLLNGRLIRKDFLLKCLRENPHDWIHAPCPDLFLLCFCAGKAVAVRSDYGYDPESFTAFCRFFRSASEWLDNRNELEEEMKYSCQTLVLTYGAFLIHQAAVMNLPESWISENFEKALIVYAFSRRHPERLSGLRLPRPEIRPAPIRRLAICCWALRSGGAERCVSLLLDFLVTLPGVKVMLILMSDIVPGDYPCPDNVEVIVLKKTKVLDRYARMVSLLKKREIDLCIFPFQYLDAIVIREHGVRVIGMEHNMLSYFLRAGELEQIELRRIAYSGADVVTCLTRAEEYYWNLAGVRTRYMPNPLTFDISTRLPFSERKNKNLIFIARMIPLKGVLDAVKAVELIRERHPDVRLIMLGRFSDPDFEAEIHKYIREHDLVWNIEFTGFTSEVEKYISSASIHLMPSQIEGYPMTLMEAKSWGVPTIAYSLPYLEAGKEEYGTIMVPQGDYEAMAAKAANLFDDFGQLNELAGKAYNSLKYFDNQMVFSRWKALFQWLETGIEPDELKMTAYSDEEKLRNLRIVSDEIIAAVKSMNASPLFSDTVLREGAAEECENNILWNILMRFYFCLRKKTFGKTARLKGMQYFFSLLWQMKRFYRLFKPWKNTEQDF